MLRIINNKILYISKRCYHKRIIDHYENPRNVGSFNKQDKNVGTGLVVLQLVECYEITD